MSLHFDKQQFLLVLRMLAIMIIEISNDYIDLQFINGLLILSNENIYLTSMTI